MLGLPTTWLVGGAAICAALFFGVTQIRHNAKLEAAHNTGVAVGRTEAAVATVEAVRDAASAERAAEADVGPLDDRADIIALCKRSASCKERRTLK